MLQGQEQKKDKETHLCGVHFLTAFTPGQGLCLIPVLGAAVDDGTGKGSVYP